MGERGTGRQKVRSVAKGPGGTGSVGAGRVDVRSVTFPLLSFTTRSDKIPVQGLQRGIEEVKGLSILSQCRCGLTLALTFHGAPLRS